MTLKRATPNTTSYSSGIGEATYANLVATEIGEIGKRIVCELGSIGGTATAITASVVGADALSALSAPMSFWFTPALDINAPATIVIDGLAPVDLVDPDGGALSQGAAVAGRRYLLTFDGSALRFATWFENGENVLFGDGDGILDDSGNEQLIFQKTAGAVNYFEITNAATGGAPRFAVAGDDANISGRFAAKGTGSLFFEVGGVDLFSLTTSGVNVAFGTITASTPFTISQTWNNAAVSFHALHINITDTASNAASFLIRTQVGGSDKFYVSKAGLASFAATVLSTDFQASGAGLYALNNAGGFFWGASADVRLYRDAANVLAQRNDANAQSFRIYNTYTDASNYERGALYWDTNVFVIGTAAAGTGTARKTSISSAAGLELAAAGGYGGSIYAGGTAFLGWNGGAGYWQLSSSGHLITPTDNTYDIGASGATRPRNIYAAGSFVAGAHLYAGSRVYIGGLSSTFLYAPSDGNLVLYNNAASNFSSLAFGGTSAAFPAIRRNATTLEFILADESDYASITGATGYFSGSLRTASSFGLISLNYQDHNCIVFGSSQDLFVYRDAADVLALRRTSNSQSFRIYETYTDASNYGRFATYMSAGIWYLGTQAAGTGTARDLVVTSSGSLIYLQAGGVNALHISATALYPQTGVNIDIGESGGRRYRDLNLARDLNLVGTVTADGNVVVGANQIFSWSGRARFYSPTATSVRLTNADDTAYAQLQAKLRLETDTVPSAASDTGSAGEIRYDASYVYVCTATNTWKRSALATW